MKNFFSKIGNSHIKSLGLVIEILSKIYTFFLSNKKTEAPKNEDKS